MVLVEGRISVTVNVVETCSTKIKQLKTVWCRIQIVKEQQKERWATTSDSVLILTSTVVFLCLYWDTISPEKRPPFFTTVELRALSQKERTFSLSTDRYFPLGEKMHYIGNSSFYRSWRSMQNYSYHSQRQKHVSSNYNLFTTNDFPKNQLTMLNFRISRTSLEFCKTKCRIQ